MRLAFLALACTLVGCKSQPADKGASAVPSDSLPAAAPAEKFEPLHPQVLQRRPMLPPTPKVAIGGDPMTPRNEGQIRPEQVVLVPENKVAGVDVDDLFQQSYMVRERDPAAAIEGFLRVLRLAPRDSPTFVKARNQLAAMTIDDRIPKELYLRGYQLKDSEPAEARMLFTQVLDLTSADPKWHEKAKAQLARLKP
jgi:hypothetical protein